MVGRRAVLAGLLATGSAAAAAPAFGPPAAPPPPPRGLARVAALARGLPQMRSMVVMLDGAVAHAEGFHGASPERPHVVKSVSKTLLSAMVGCARDRGHLADLDRPMVDLIGERVPRGADPRVGRITLDHLLTMRAGLERTSFDNYHAWVSSPDWVADVLRRPFVAAPGGRYVYSTGSSHLLGAALAAETGESLLALAREWLGKPLDCELPPWTRDPQGLFLGGNDMAIPPLALARFGEAFRLGGRGLVSGGWVQDSWALRTVSTGSGHAYGYGWFLATAKGWEVSFATGYGGQMLYVAPELALTVVMTSDPGMAASGHVRRLNHLFASHIVPAVTG